MEVEAGKTPAFRVPYRMNLQPFTRPVCTEPRSNNSIMRPRVRVAALSFTHALCQLWRETTLCSREDKPFNCSVCFDWPNPLPGKPYALRRGKHHFKVRKSVSFNLYPFCNFHELWCVSWTSWKQKQKQKPYGGGNAEQRFLHIRKAETVKNSAVFLNK